jgi:hypothetical protein
VTREEIIQILFFINKGGELFSRKTLTAKKERIMSSLQLWAPLSQALQLKHHSPYSRIQLLAR